MIFNRFIAIISFALFSFSALAGSLSVNGPERIGVVTNRPFLYLIPATGSTDLQFKAAGLPSGLKLNSQTGIISGDTSSEGEFQVVFTVSDSTGVVNKTVTMVVGAKAIALTPIMGWNPWYVWGCNINDKKIREAADLLVSSGLAAHGYNYINLDDCWQGKRNEAGEMVPNANFPDMKALADYVHSKGLRIGMYTGPGKTTCGGYLATQDLDFEKGVSYLDQDVNLYAKWGFDFIKYDYCIFPSDQRESDYYKSKQQVLYQRMSDAIEKSSRSMVHMICQYGELEVYKWGPTVGGHMWRTNHDLADTWPAVLRNGFANMNLSKYAGPSKWNDLDMLMVGKANWPKKLGDYDIPGTTPRPTQLTRDEQITHMTLWSMMASPLLFSSDLTQLDPFTLSLLTNDEMISVNQDALGSPISIVFDSPDKKVITRKMSDGTLAVAMFNLGRTNQSMAFDGKMIGLSRSLKVKNLWTGETVNAGSRFEVTVPAHGAFFGRIAL